MTPADSTLATFAASVADRFAEVSRAVGDDDGRPFSKTHLSGLDVMARYVRGVATGAVADDPLLRALRALGPTGEYVPGPWARRALGRLAADYVGHVDPAEVLLELVAHAARDRADQLKASEDGLATEYEALHGRIRVLEPLQGRLADAETRAGLLEQEATALRAWCDQLEAERAQAADRIESLRALLPVADTAGHEPQQGPRDARPYVDEYITKRVSSRGELFYVWGPDPKRGGKKRHIPAGDLHDAYTLRARLYPSFAGSEEHSAEAPAGPTPGDPGEPSGSAGEVLTGGER